MKKLLVMSLVLIMSISLAVTAYATAEPAEPDTPPASEGSAELPDDDADVADASAEVPEADAAGEESAGQQAEGAVTDQDATQDAADPAPEPEPEISSSNVVDGSVLSVDADDPEDAGDADPDEDGAEDAEADAEVTDGKFRIFGFTISNIITTLLVVGVFVTGVVTKKMGKW